MCWVTGAVTLTTDVCCVQGADAETTTRAVADLRAPGAVGISPAQSPPCFGRPESRGVREAVGRRRKGTGRGTTETGLSDRDGRATQLGAAGTRREPGGWDQVTDARGRQTQALPRKLAFAYTAALGVLGFFWWCHYGVFTGEETGVQRGSESLAQILRGGRARAEIQAWRVAKRKPFSTTPHSF